MVTFSSYGQQALFALTLSPALVPYSIVSLLQSISIPLLNISRIPQVRGGGQMV
jgi:hypothetical protein